ncbi:UNVERIFIED_CONTAM: hypothetical protein HDU68_002445 [Siphonaria sp. JEL0065]|nr:hypothetical protein HDU68_002445 [Siphonaria sp. JEL0065]
MRIKQLPPRIVTAILRYVFASVESKGKKTEALLVSRGFLSAGSVLLLRSVAVDGERLGLLVHVLLGGSSLNTLLVRSLVVDETVQAGDVDTLLQLCPLVAHVTAAHVACNSLLVTLADYAQRLGSLNVRDASAVSSLHVFNLFVRRCRRLHTLDAAFTNLPVFAAITAIDNLPLLARLNLEAAQPSSEPVVFDFASTPKKSALKFLNMRNCPVDNLHISYIALKCPMLTTLYLDGCTSLTDDAVVAIARNCHTLQSLDISFLSNITDLSLYALALSPAICHSLQVLVLSGCIRITPKGVQTLIDANYEPARVELRHYSVFRTNGLREQGDRSFVDLASSSLDDSLPPPLSVDYMSPSSKSASASFHHSNYPHQPPPAQPLITSVGSLRQLVLHGCPNIIHSYLAKFDVSRSGDLECMLEGNEIKLAVGAKDPAENILLSPTAATAVKGVPPNEYTLDSNELWMLAAYNMRVLSNPSFESLYAMTESESDSSGGGGGLGGEFGRDDADGDGGDSNRSSVQSMDMVLQQSMLPKSSLLESSNALKRMSSSSASSSTSTTTKSSRLPAFASKLPGSKLRTSTSGGSRSTSSLPKPSFSSGLPAPKSRLYSSSSATSTSIAQPKVPTKINFNGYNNNASSSLVRPSNSSSISSPSLAKSGSRVSTMTLSSYSRTTGNASSAMNNSSNTPTPSSSYKPRTFKKFNDTASDFAPSKPPSKSMSTSIATTTTSSSSFSRNSSASSNSTSSALKKVTSPTGPPTTSRGLGSALKPPPSIKRTSLTNNNNSASSSNSSGGSSAPISYSTPQSSGGLDRWRRKTITNDSTSEDASADTTTTQPQQFSSSSLDRWRSPAVTAIVDEPTTVRSSLDKWRSPAVTAIVADDTAAVTPAVRMSLDKWRSPLPGSSVVDSDSGLGRSSLDKWRSAPTQQSTSANDTGSGSGLDKWRKPGTSSGSGGGGSRLKPPSRVTMK